MLRTWTARFGGATATTADFTTLAEEISGRSSARSSRHGWSRRSCPRCPLWLPAAASRQRSLLGCGRGVTGTLRTRTSGATTLGSPTPS
ncbi:hypothetical protein NKG05_11300 [Oerskovia sp. M15]